MDQTLINWLLTGFGALIGMFLKIVWDAVKDLQKADTDLAVKVSNVQSLILGDYVKRADWKEDLNGLLDFLRRIEDKLDKKVDKQ